MPRAARGPSVAVIGAGASGPVACTALARYGLDVTTYEAGSRVGGQWVLDNSSGTSAAYRSLHTNTHKGMSRYADYPLPDDYPRLPEPRADGGLVRGRCPRLRPAPPHPPRHTG